MRLTSITLAMMLVVSVPPVPQSDAFTCTPALAASGGCASENIDQLVVTDSVSSSPSRGTSQAASGPGRPAGSRPTPSRPLTPAEENLALARQMMCDIGLWTPEYCAAPEAPLIPAGPPPPAAGPSIESVTISDLASFTPAVGELVVQPDGWGVLGVPTNFVATASDHVQSGTLLGEEVEVRWRPISFAFDYGDGTTATTTTPGTSWRDGDDDWTSTATSHVYEERGTVTASVTVTFAADVDAGDGWRAVPGTLDASAPSQQVRVYEVQTVLTRGDCLDHPGDPGCEP